MTSWIAQAVPFADAWGMHDGDVGFGWWLVMTLGMVAFWGAVIAVVVWALRGGVSASRPPGDASAREILDRRLADGSIDLDEYERRRLLDDAGTSAGPSRQPNALGGSP
jgi:putative membrane protein